MLAESIKGEHMNGIFACTWIYAINTTDSFAIWVTIDYHVAGKRQTQARI